MPSSPITDSSLEGEWLWESGEVFYIAVNGHLAKTKRSGNLRDGVDQLPLVERLFLGSENLEVGDLHLGEILFSLS